MNLPFDNNTRKLEKRFAARSVKYEKCKNILFVITVSLATCLILAISLFFSGSLRRARIDAEGRYQAVVQNLEESKMQRIREDDRVKAGISYLLGHISYEDKFITVRTMDEALLQLAKYPAIVGRLPEKEDEIAVTQGYLSMKGLQAEPGDALAIDLGHGEKEYRVCGILPAENNNYSVYVSTAYIRSQVDNPLYSVYISVKESAGWSETELRAEFSKLAEDWGLRPEQIKISTYYYSLLQQRSSQYILIILLVSVVAALACALVIYSLFYVSIVRKTNEYGKLRTIGATKKQVKGIVLQECSLLSGIAIPVGLLAGTLSGYILVPDGWTMKTALIMAGLTSLFMFSCVKLTVIRPAHFAAQVTPVEAVRYSAASELSGKAVRKPIHSRLTANRLAVINLTKNKKKTILTVLSLGICGVLLMASSAYFHSINPLNMARRSFPYGEIRLEIGIYGPLAYSAHDYYELQKENLFTPHFIHSIEQIEGVKGVREFGGACLNLVMPTGDSEFVVTDAIYADTRLPLEDYLIAGTADYQSLLEGKGIVLVENTQWKDLFGWEPAVGDEISLESGAGVVKKVKVMGLVKNEITYGGYDTLFMPKELLAELVPLDNLNYQLFVDTQDDEWESVKDKIEGLIPSGSPVYISTLNSWIESFQEKLSSYRVPVYIFEMFIGVFGIINLLNTLITNMLTRKREFGILQAVGLSERQLSGSILLEGFLYILGVLVLSVTLGTLTGYLLCRVFSAMSVFGQVEYQFPVWEMTGYMVLLLLVQSLFSRMIIGQFRKQPLVDRIRELV